MFSRVHSSTIVVSDQDAALDFYVNTLGWTKELDERMGESMRFITVVPPEGGAQIALGLAGWFDDEGRAPGRTGISLLTPDIDAAYKTLTERGVRFKQSPIQMPFGRATWFYDPDGNEFFLVEGE